MENSKEHTAVVKPVQKRLLIPIFALLFILIITFYIAFFLLLNNQIEDKQKVLSAQVTNMLKHLKHERVTVLTALETQIAQDKRLPELIKKKARKKLYQRYNHIYEVYHRIYGISHFYFHNKDLTTLLRIHKPKQYGDKIDRYTLLQAQKKRKTISGIELGTFGTYTLRVVTPVMDRGNIVGFIELGINYKRFLQKLSSFFNINTALFIEANKNNSLNATRLKHAHLKLIGDKTLKQNHFLSYSTLKEIDQYYPEFFKIIHLPSQTTQVTLNDRIMQVSSIMIHDINGKKVGDLLIFNDITAIKASFDSLIILFSVGTLLVILVLFSSLKALLALTDKEIAKQEATIKYQAHYDTLTGLPNRLLSLDRLEQFIRNGNRENQRFALLFVDLDDFKKVNDTLGHDIGDLLLIEVSNRLSKHLRAVDTVGRLGGDEFIILLQHIHEPEDATIVVKNILKSFERPFEIQEHQIFSGCSIGVAIYPEDGAAVADILRSADLAMYHAKMQGKQHYARYQSSMSKKLTQRVQIENQLQEALANHEFSVCYQPQIDLVSEKVSGAEALLRWENPTLGSVPTDTFIPIIEQNGMILEIGMFVLTQLFQTLHEWKEQGITLSISVNLSPKQFEDHNLIPFIKSQLQSLDLSGDQIQIELTEEMMMQATKEAKETISSLKELGIMIAMDNFGTGYASLSYLRRFPFDILKIDRTFITHMLMHKDDRALVDTSIAIAKSLKLKVIAVGVEDARAISYLKERGCSQAQGFYYAQAMDTKAFEAFLRNFDEKG